METKTKYEALRKEIDDMLSVLQGDWLVKEIRLDSVWYSAVMTRREEGDELMASGLGRSKAEALEKILENWQKGMSEPYAPAAGSAEELRLKMAVRKG